MDPVVSRSGRTRVCVTCGTVLEHTTGSLDPEGDLHMCGIIRTLIGRPINLWKCVRLKANRLSRQPLPPPDERRGDGRLKSRLLVPIRNRINACREKFASRRGPDRGVRSSAASVLFARFENKPSGADRPGWDVPLPSVRKVRFPSVTRNAAPIAAPTCSGVLLLDQTLGRALPPPPPPRRPPGRCAGRHDEERRRLLKLPTHLPLPRGRAANHGDAPRTSENSCDAAPTQDSQAELRSWQSSFQTGLFLKKKEKKEESNNFHSVLFFINILAAHVRGFSDLCASVARRTTFKVNVTPPFFFLSALQLPFCS